MRQLVMVLGLTLFSVSASYADTPTALNEPSETWRRLKEVVETLKPQGGALLDLHDGGWKGIATVALYELRRDDQALGSLRGGYLGDHGVLGSLEANLGRVIPTDWPVVPVLAKYLKVGYGVGYEFGDDRVAHGPTLSVELSF